MMMAWSRGWRWREETSFGTTFEVEVIEFLDALNVELEKEGMSGIILGFLVSAKR